MYAHFNVVIPLLDLKPTLCIDFLYHLTQIAVEVALKFVIVYYYLKTKYLFSTQSIRCRFKDRRAMIQVRCRSNMFSNGVIPAGVHLYLKLETDES